MIIKSMDNPLRRSKAEIAQVIHSVWPNHKHSSLTFLAEGWEYNVWEVDNKYIFRFPKRIQGYSDLRKEVILLKRIGGELSVRVPDYSILGSSPDDSGYVFAAYDKIAGLPLIDIWPSCPSEIVAEHCGRFLRELHSISLEVAASCSIGPPCSDIFHPNRLLEQATVYLPDIQSHLVTSGVNIGACYDALNRIRVSLCEYDEGDPVLLHGDFRADHILTNPDVNALSGIIDWGNAMIGPPHWDMIWLWIFFDDSFMAPLLGSYGADRRVESLSHIKDLGICKSIFEMYLGSITNDQRKIALGLSALRRTFPM